MRDFAKRFYGSRAWQDVRRAVYIAASGICERCSGAGVIVHHKVYLSPQNIDDAAVTLNPANLELLCYDCHADEHQGRLPVAAGLRWGPDGELMQMQPGPGQNWGK